MKRILCVAQAALLLLLSAAAVPAAAAPEAAAVGSALQEKSVTAHIFSMKDTEKIDCLFDKNMPEMPYIRAEDYLNRIFTEPFSSSKNADGSYSVSNANGAMIVDAERDTVTFERMEDVMLYDVVPAFTDEKGEYLQEEDLEIIGECKSVTLDLGKYDIDVVEEGDSVYFPLTTIADIFGVTYLSAQYFNGELWFIKIADEEQYYDTSARFQTTKRTHPMIEYTYHELCFVMDSFYGAPPRADIAASIRTKGFDKTLDDYSSLSREAKELLLSDSLTDFCYGMIYLDSLLSDGGHTLLSYGTQTALEKYPDSPFSKAMTAELRDWTNAKNYNIYSMYDDMLDRNRISAELEDLREEAVRSMDEIRVWDDAAFYLQDKTGFFTFDSFTDAMVEPFKWSLDYAQEHGAENFVIDITTNGGGVTNVVYYILSVLTGKTEASMYYGNSCTGNTLSEVCTIDKNLDGEFDEKDKDVIYDFRFAILTSRCSFSCANTLPCLAQEKGIPVIGETTGGGACMLGELFYPAEDMYVLSFMLTATLSSGQDIDGGAEADVFLTQGSQYNPDYSGMYDLAKINEAIDTFYQNAAPTVADEESTFADEESAAETEGEREQPQKSSSLFSGEMLFYLWIILLSAGTILTVTFAVLLLCRRRKNR